MKKTIAVLFATFLVGTGCSSKAQIIDKSSVLSDKNATTETKILYNNLAQLTQKGILTLAENITQEVFDGEVNTTIMFSYGKDFGMGDIVQLVGEYGIEGKARVTELIRSQSITGINICPAFTIIK